MRRNLPNAVLLLYPRRVRKGHGPEMLTLIDDLITHERRSPTALLIRLAADGLVQRIASTATTWTVLAVLAATSLGGLGVSDFASAHALRRAPHTMHTPARHTHQTSPNPVRWWRRALAGGAPGRTDSSPGGRITKWRSASLVQAVQAVPVKPGRRDIDLPTRSRQRSTSPLVGQTTGGFAFNAMVRYSTGEISSRPEDGRNLGDLCDGWRGGAGDASRAFIAACELG